MQRKAYFLITGILFTVVAFAHLLRLVFGWQILVDGTTVPLWVSWTGLAVAGALALWALALARHSGHYR